VGNNKENLRVFDVIFFDMIGNFNIIPWDSNIKKAEQCPPSFPKSYHELNLLMLWFFKCRPRVLLLESF